MLGEAIETDEPTNITLGEDGKTVSATIANDSADEVMVRVIVAAYDDDRLSETAISQYVTIPAGDDVSDVVVALENNTDGKIVKAFIWNDAFVPFTAQWLLKP